MSLYGLSEVFAIGISLSFKVVLRLGISLMLIYHGKQKAAEFTTHANSFTETEPCC